MSVCVHTHACVSVCKSVGCLVFWLVQPHMLPALGLCVIWDRYKVSAYILPRGFYVMKQSQKPG